MMSRRNSEVPAGPGALTIGEVAARTGLSVPTLRMWESRHGAPAPQRLPGGHRRYSQRDVELVLSALRARESGLSVAAALDLAQATADATSPRSLFAGLRRARPDLHPAIFPKRVLVSLSRALEDDCCSRAERPLLFGSFQRERFHRAAAPRWRELARTAELAVVFADFKRSQALKNGLVQIRVERSDPLLREWAIICDAPGCEACLVASEVPGQGRVSDGDRRFETIWTTEPLVVRAASEIAWRLARAALPSLPAVVAVLERPAHETPGGTRRVVDLANRMLAYAEA